MAFKKLVLAAFIVALTGGVSGQDPNYILSISSGNIPQGGSGTLTANLDNNGAEISGWSHRVCNDTAALICTDAVDGADTATIAGGDPPGFDAIAIYDEGYTVGVVIDLFGAFVMPPGTGYELNVATYTGVVEGTTTVAPCDSVLGSPPVDVVVVVGGASITPTMAGGTADVVGILSYLRGDANSDGRVNIADGVWIISELFLAGASSTCPASRDANGDGGADAADAVYIFTYRFSDGPAPSDPFPDCGTSVGQDDPDVCAASGCG